LAEALDLPRPLSQRRLVGGELRHHGCEALPWISADVAPQEFVEFVVGPEKPLRRFRLVHYVHAHTHTLPAPATRLAWSLPQASACTSSSRAHSIARGREKAKYPGLCCLAD